MSLYPIIRSIVLLLISMMVYDGVIAQTKAQLEAQKNTKRKELQEINKILAEISGKKRFSLGQLNAINAKINTIQSLIVTIKKEVEKIEEDISETELIIDALEADLKALKAEYAKMIYQASKISNSYNQLTFILSAKTFNQLFRRLQYIQQYTEARKRQVAQIQRTKNILLAQNKLIVSQKKEKSDVLNQLQQENQELEVLKASQKQVTDELASKENEIKEQLNAERSAYEEIERRIKEEIAKNIEASKTTPEERPTSTENIKLSASFSKNRGRLPWPVETGFISGQFGIRRHPVFANIRVKNDGVKIQTKNGMKVKSVFDGKVEVIYEVPGNGYSVIVNHGGEYFTVYQGVDNVVVKKEDRLQPQQVIGDAYINREGISEITFCIFKDTQSLDPEKWLNKR